MTVGVPTSKHDPAFFLPSVSLSSKNSNVLVQKENFRLHSKILKNDIFFNILIKIEKKVSIDLIIMLNSLDRNPR